MRLNTLGVELGGPGEWQSRVDHNCFRDNRYAVANQRYALSNGRIDDNTTFRTATITYEIGWSLAGARNVVVDDNVAHDTGFYVVVVESSSAIRVEANDIRTTREGVRVGPANTVVRVAGNSISGAGPGLGVAGVLVVPPGARAATTGLVIADNDVSAMGAAQGRGITLGVGAQPAGAAITGNRVHDNAFEGLALAPGNRASTITGNTATGNAVRGIRLAAGASANVLTGNTALGNGTDAADLGAVAGSVLPNQWVDTTCVTDVPVGAICVPREPRVSP